MNLFNFSLIPTRDSYYPRNGFQPGLQIQHSPKERNIAWSWLTEGEYFMDLNGVQPYKYTNQWRKKYALTETYLLDKNDDFLYGVFNLLPLASVSLPDDVFRFIDTPFKQQQMTRLFHWSNQEDEILSDTIREEITQYVLRPFNYRQMGCNYWFFRVGESMVIRYDFTQKDKEDCIKWEAGSGEYILPYNRFISEIKDFTDRFFDCMQKRVEEAIELKYNIIGYENKIRTDEANGIFKQKEDYLREETQVRREYFDKTLAGYNIDISSIDWDRIKEELIILSKNS